MALRPSKISSEIFQTCNKFFSSTTDATLKSKISLNDSQALRYRITNTGKPEGLPELNFHEEPGTLFSDLQPSAKPEFQFDCSSPKWAEKPMDNNPFPSSIKQQNHAHIMYSDQQKAEDKMLKYKLSGFNGWNRHFSTITDLPISRKFSGKPPAENSGAGTCKKKINKCYKEKHRDCRVPNQDCPRFKILDCEQSKGSNCKLNYLDPNCTKKFAPYPSYSESCAENLPDDPSECQQCPWRTCDGADTIEPGKPVRNKRNYSTTCMRHLDATAGIVVAPLFPPPSVKDVAEHICKPGECNPGCGQIKHPCKRPKGPCEVRREKEEQIRREKEIRIPPKPKKRLEEANNRMVLQQEEGNALNLSKINPVNSWIDLFAVEEMLLKRKPKHPNCPSNKKPKRPADNEIDNSLLLLTSEYKCKKRIKGDEGHPPPCEEKGWESLKCPEKPLKKPKYKKRPMNQGYYKRPEDPYNKSNGT